MAPAPLLEIKNLRTYFSVRGHTARAVDDVSLSILPGQTLGLVGESGCGKSVTAHSIMRLIPSPPGRIAGGEILFEGQDLVTLSEAQMRRIRGNRISMIFQEPMTSLNPTYPVGDQVEEVIRLHEKLSRAAARERSVDMFKLVGIPAAEKRIDDYPHQMSGGMRQRVMIAMALSCDPSVLIADEPTTALDVTVQAQIVDLIEGLQKKLGMAIIWITHDLALVAGLAHRVAVMYAGHIVEEAPVGDIYQRPRHPYTLGLLRSMPKMGGIRRAHLDSIPGQPPELWAPFLHCPFAPRCSFTTERCHQERPELQEVGPGHKSACWNWGVLAPETVMGDRSSPRVSSSAGQEEAP